MKSNLLTTPRQNGGSVLEHMMEKLRRKTREKEAKKEEMRAIEADFAIMEAEMKESKWYIPPSNGESIPNKLKRFKKIKMEQEDADKKRKQKRRENPFSCNIEVVDTASESCSRTPHRSNRRLKMMCQQRQSPGTIIGQQSAATNPSLKENFCWIELDWHQTKALPNQRLEWSRTRKIRQQPNVFVMQTVWKIGGMHRQDTNRCSSAPSPTLSQI